MSLGRKVEDFHHKYAIQLNDTHPSIGVAELMAILSGILFALRGRSGDQPDPQRAVAVLRDGLRAGPPPIPRGATGGPAPAGRA